MIQSLGNRYQTNITLHEPTSKEGLEWDRKTNHETPSEVLKSFIRIRYGA